MEISSALNKICDLLGVQCHQLSYSNETQVDGGWYITIQRGRSSVDYYVPDNGTPQEVNPNAGQSAALYFK